MSLEELASKSAKEKQANSKNGHYIVAIGASAGGLEAIHEFFDNMPENSNLSFVVIQHLSPDYKSLLVELVAKHTHMKVFEAEHGMSVHKECVYIIPNKKLMTIRDGKLELKEKVQEKAPNTAIDYFLRTLAEDQKDKSIAVILSGTGTDGTRGIEAIKECGGMVIVQDPVTAKFDGMPNSAITSGNADFILPPEMMPEEIYNHIHENPIHVLNKGKIDDGLLAEIFSRIYKTNGYDFHYYKTPTIIRRIGKRMGQNGISNLKEYVDYLHKNDEEVNRLSKDFLIGVTKFFRDQPAYDSLFREVLPAILLNKKENDILKVWVCACSTGEEAYSIAILIDKYLRKVRKNLDVKIFATDIDESNIDFAARNLYPDTIAKDINAEIFEQYFLKDGKYYSVIPQIRKQIVFARHNVIKDPPFIKNDIVSCRNMLIYMNNVLQQKVLSTLHFSLNMDGYLFLGPSETINSIRDCVYEVNSKWKIFRKISKNKNQPYEIYRPIDGRTPIPRSMPELPKLDKVKTNPLMQDFSESMIEDFGYVCFYIDLSFDIKEAAGNYNRFLSLPEKNLNLNLLKMVPQELSVAINTAVRRSWKEKRKIFLKSVRVKSKDTETFVSISVTPARPSDGKLHTLIILGEHHQSHIHQKEDSNILSSAEQTQYVNELEIELTEARSNLQMAIEGMETTNEELQSSNEELLSANEELQSSNEELQSLNEELHTLNTEHQLKIKELIELNDDLNNFFRSTDIGQIFLDSDSRIRKFNSAAVSMINLIESDIGRPINHISTNIRYDNLLKNIQQVLNDGSTIEKEVILNNDSRCLMRILPYIRQDKTRDGAIVTFVDISAIENLNNIINGVFNSSLNAIVAFKAVRNNNGGIIDFELQTANYEAEKVFNIKGPTEGKRLSMLHSISDQGLLDKYHQVANSGIPLHTELSLSDNDIPKWFEVVAVKMRDGFVATFSDITDKKNAEIRLKTNYNELIEVRENLKRLNLQLEDKVRERTRELSVSEERFRLVSQATNDAIWDWNLADNSIWWSESFYRLFGYKEDKLNQNSDFWQSKVHFEDLEAVKQSLDKAINGNEKQWHAEYRFLKADGKYAYILDRGHLLHDEYGTPYRMLGSMLDVSDLIKANETIRKNEERFRFLANTIPQKVWTATADGHLEYINKVFLDFTGKSSEELIEKGWELIVHPDDLELNLKLWKISIKTGQPFEMERRLLSAEGEYRWHLSRAIPQFDETGSTTMWVGTSTDIDEQKNVSEALKISEDYFRQLSDEAPFMIWKVDEAGRCNYVNQRWMQATGLSFDESMNLGWGKAFHPEDGEREYTKFMKAFNSRQPYNSKFRIKFVDGEYHWVLAKSNPIIADVFDGYIGSLTDITEQEMAQEALKLLMKKKDEFMSIASHELKTPITSMKGSLQIAERLTRRGADMKEIYSFLEKANKQVNRLTGLVDDLLDVTKITAGRLEFHLSTFAIGDAIQDCLDEVQHDNITHRIIVEGDRNIEVNADRHRLEQVIVNFISNAIKYSPDADKIILNIGIENNMLKVSVTDFGIGIPENKKNFVFDRFFRVQESSAKFSGLGLGLFISAEIIKRHGGRVGVISEENKGSSFWFTLPL